MSACPSPSWWQAREGRRSDVKEWQDKRSSAKVTTREGRRRSKGGLRCTQIGRRETTREERKNEREGGREG